MSGDRLAYSVAETAAAIGVGERLVWELVASGQLPSRKLGSRRLILREDLVRFLRNLDDHEGVAPDG